MVIIQADNVNRHQIFLFFLQRNVQSFFVVSFSLARGFCPSRVVVLRVTKALNRLKLDTKPTAFITVISVWHMTSLLWTRLLAFWRAAKEFLSSTVLFFLFFFYVNKKWTPFHCCFLFLALMYLWDLFYFFSKAKDYFWVLMAEPVSG